MRDIRTLILEKECIRCHKSYELRIVDKDYEEWQKGKSAEESMPYIPKNAIGIIETGICGDCEKKKNS